MRHQLRSIAALSLLVTTTAWGVSSGHLPISASASADTRVVSVYADGQKKIISTDATTVREILERASIKLAQGDLVEPTPDTVVPQGFFNINVYRAKPVTVVDGSQSYQLFSAYSSPRLVASSAGVETYPQDSYKSEVVTDFVSENELGIKLTVIRSIPFSVKADGKTQTLRALPGDVASALESAGVVLGPKDTVSVPLDTPITTDLKISIARVTDVESTVTETLKHSTVKVEDPKKPKGHTRVREEGTDGEQTAVYRIHYRDGAETSRQLISVVSRVEPKPEVVEVGTKLLFAGSVEYWRPLVEEAAAKYGMSATTMMRIMNCESTGNALASNGTHFGLFQYLPSTWRAAGGTDDNIFDGPTQITITARKMARYGTGPWECK